MSKMWKDYSKSYIKNNRASSISVMAAAFVATGFLSLLCCIAYNFWAYEMESIVASEGDWQGRIEGRISEEDLALIQNFANVERAVFNQELSEGGEAVVDVYFRNVRRIYRDMPLISAQLGLKKDAVQYHSLLLSRYLIHDQEDEQPPMLLGLYLGILLIVAVSLILIIRNSFELSMNARIHQFGIFSSIGATPKQIRICLLQEALALSVLPILVGSLTGIGVSYGVIGLVNFYARGVSGRHEAVFQYRPFLFVVTFVSGVLTVFFSAWMPAGKLSRMTPLEAIRNTGSLQLKKRKRSRILGLLFGMEGELAGNALKAQKKSLRISTVSLLLSFLGFSIMLCFTTLSGISTRFTYFERYQDAWDIMITVKNTGISDFDRKEELGAIPGAGDVTVYQKAMAAGVLSEDWLSDELAALGGFGFVAGKPGEAGEFSVEIPIIILDDASFLAYCSEIGVPPSLEGAIVYNRIWDRVNSNFRYKEYVPFVKEDRRVSVIGGVDGSGQSVEIPVLSYTETAPVLREEYKNYGLVHFLPLAVWREVGGQIGGGEPDCFVRIFSDGNGDLADLSRLEAEAVRRIGRGFQVESENRVQERISNDDMMNGMMVIFGAFCALLALIGIANVFSNTLGFLRQRKREFAQYMSVGLTPGGMRKMFCVEAVVIAGKPLLITLPLTVVFVQFAVTASFLEPMVFWAEAPVLPVFLFGAAVVFFVALAYYIGGRRILRCDLNEALRNDALM